MNSRNALEIAACYNGDALILTVKKNWRIKTIVVLPMTLLWISAISCLATTQPASTGVRHVVVYREEGRFAGWPANHGIWSWGNEILVGFSRGYYKDLGRFHHIDREKPEEFLLARSRDGGETWSVEEPRPRGMLAGTPGMRHGTMPPGLAEDQLKELREPIRFD